MTALLIVAQVIGLAVLWALLMAGGWCGVVSLTRKFLAWHDKRYWAKHPDPAEMLCVRMPPGSIRYARITYDGPEWLHYDHSTVLPVSAFSKADRKVLEELEGE